VGESGDPRGRGADGVALGDRVYRDQVDVHKHISGEGDERIKLGIGVVDPVGEGVLKRRSSASLDGVFGEGIP